MYEVQFSSVDLIRFRASSSEAILKRAITVFTRAAVAARRKTWSAPGKSRRMYPPPRPTITTLPARAASWMTCCVICSTALRVSKVGSVRDVVDDPGLEQVDFQASGEHVPHRLSPRSELAANRDDRHAGPNLAQIARKYRDAREAGLVSGH